jgi:hypothetical protein
MESAVKRNLIAAFAAILLGQVCFMSEAIAELNLPKRTPDGRFDTLCSSWGGGGNFNEVCQLSFARLMSEPEKYQGRLIAVVGFLIREQGKLMLYPSRESYEGGHFGEGILILGEVHNSLKEKLKMGASSVLCVGVFDATYLGEAVPALGAMRNIQNITYNPGRIK